MAYFQDLRGDRHREEIAAIAVCVWLAYAHPAVHDCWYKRELEWRAANRDLVDRGIVRKDAMARACASIGTEAYVLEHATDCTCESCFPIDPNNEPGDGE